MEPIESLELAQVVKTLVRARLISGIDKFQYVASVRVRYGDGREVSFSGQRLNKKVAHKVGVKLLTKRAKAAAESLAKRIEAASGEAISSADKPELQRKAVKAAVSQERRRRAAARIGALEQVRGILRAWPDMELEELIDLWNLVRVEEIQTG